jgi:outer membrane protein assembly factor BamB
VVQQYVPAKSWSKILRKLSLSLAIAAVSMATLGGCAEPVPFKHNPVAVMKMGSLESTWFVDLNSADDPIVNVDVRDKLVYIYFLSKRVVAFDRKAGTLQMTMHVKSPNRFLLPLVELKDRIVFPNATTLEVFDSKGFFEKSVVLDSPLRSNCAGDGEDIFFGSVSPRGGLVESYNVQRPLAPFNWEYLTYDGGDVTAGIASYAGIIYSGSEGGEVDAVAVNRSQLWDTPHGNFMAAGPITADLKADEAGLYVASKDSKLYCINRTTGKLKWQYFAGTPLTDSPTTTSDMLYEYVPGKGLAALDKLNGAYNRSPRWIHPTATQFLAEDEKYAYLADPRPNPEDPDQRAYAIIAVDKVTMKQAFESSHKDFAILGTNRKDSLIYGAFADGKLFAIRPVLKAGHIGEMVMVPTENKCKVQSAEHGKIAECKANSDAMSKTW